MNFVPKQPSGPGGKGRRRRNRRSSSSRPGQPGQPSRHQDSGRPPRPRQPGIFTAPMDHSYRTNQQGSNGNGGRSMGKQYLQPDPEPLPDRDENATTRIFAMLEDLFFLAKIQETARKLNVKVEFVKTDKEILERVRQNGTERPSLIIMDLNIASAKPLTSIPKLKRELKKETTIIGFLSHVQGDLKLKALEAGCDMVLPRSSFSQNLPQLLRRHGEDVPVE
ncbi:MAG TPA: hypothetical protein VG892_00600 [Terriglobales bacterium]|nr:hypothetical protein [Terriglobales bacterium]